MIQWLVPPGDPSGLAGRSLSGGVLEIVKGQECVRFPSVRQPFLLGSRPSLQAAAKDQTFLCEGVRYTRRDARTWASANMSQDEVAECMFLLQAMEDRERNHCAHNQVHEEVE